MKKTISCSFLFLLPFLTMAKIWRLNNNGANPNPPIVADFLGTLQQAHDNVGVLSGDTIHVEQSPVTYGPCLFTKRLILIGVGYHLSNNPQTQVNTAYTSKTDYLTFDNAGSIGSKIFGLSSTGCTIAVDNIELSRCNFTSTLGGGMIKIGTTNSSDITNTKINGCFFSYGYFVASVLYSGGSLPIISNNSGSGKSLNTNIQGNIFLNTSGGTTISGSYFLLGAGIVLNSNTNGIIKNNIFNCNVKNIDVQNFYLLNNIAESGPSANSFTNCRFEYNLGINDNQFITANEINSAKGLGNQTMASFGFVGGTSPDGKYQITSGAALTAGKTLLPCGIFGGDFPYHLSGLAPVPNIYTLSLAPVAAGATTMDVTASSKSNN